MKLYIAGFALSLIGSLPPGLISLTVANTAIHRTMAIALLMAFGAASAEFVQAWIAVDLSDFFLSHPSVETGFKWVAMCVFFTLAVYLFFFAKSGTPGGERSGMKLSNPYVKGLIISAFNLMAIPYWFTYCGWLRLEGWWEEGLFSTIIFAAGVSSGTFAALSLYAWLGTVIVQRAENIARYANRFIALVFLAMGLKLMFGLING
ncbi:MAG: LysE family transporter [Lewinellaceae bacterium]|nr:LysE family transporter [Saprospiraceae bacterium]MCB9345533.1 LysE family transporter [Lewinellaceae bacterium]